ncbi:beta strand repeat-containing protein [Aphanothece sacrum]|uniref:Calcium binding hemolysin protein n=1 Tax=Aphanothece sacrum FPU1 TaxID=1920663 RepID=A0A401IMV4_APHSA|nr:lectin-like protein [Aphanothece sacrum]GBF82577.1 calcium binding hemolysin protein [Aphanothece sacrum FPU1]GBF84711.1 calcium binding hemolysin protein [Aphanothece sacrum FPU3]
MAIIRGTNLSEILNGVLGENDIIYGLAGNDIINGNAGNDALYGEAALYQGKYYLFTDSLSWTAAQAQAVALGGNLVTVNDLAENQWLTANFGGQGNLWLGLTDQSIEGSFSWINGETITATYRNWLTGQPTNVTGLEDYASLNIASGLWSSLPNTTIQRGIIEIETISTGNDTLNGGAGNDTLFGGLGDDSLDGGLDTDTADYSGLSQAITLSGLSQSITLLPILVVNKGSAGTDNLTSIERVIGAIGQANTIDASTVTNFAPDATLNANLLTQSVVTNTGIATVPNVSFTAINFLNVIGTNNNDTITGDNNNNVLSGGLGNDSLSGNGGNDTLNGGAGNDSLIGGTGNDSLDGGLDTDTADYSGLGQAITLSGSIQAITLLPILVVNKGSAGTDNLTSIERVIGAIGQANTIDASTVTNFAPDATLNANLTSQFVVANTGIATVPNVSFTAINFLNVIGTNNNDTIVGDNANNRLTGGEGNDTLNGGAGGNDSLFGGAGNDNLIGGTGNDSLDGGLDTDTVDYSALGQAVTIRPQGSVSKGTAGTDQLVSIERIIGATGQVNLIDASTATNFGSGATINVNLASQSVLINTGIATPPSVSFTAINFVNAIGTNNNDTLTGDTGNNNLSGLSGNDILDGGTGGNDSLFGGAGNDSLIGGTGNDSLDGGGDTDTANYSAIGQAITYQTTGFVSKGTAGTDQLVSVERIIGATAQSNTIDASTSFTINANLATQSLTVNGSFILGLENFVNVNGTANNDTIVGDNANNTLTGGGGNDTLNGGAGGNDSLFGGAGNDSLIGGTGNDSLDGGADTDTVDYSALGQAVTVRPFGVVSKGIAGTDNLTSIERIIGAVGLTNTIDSSTTPGTGTINVNLANQSLIVNTGVATPPSIALTVTNFTNVIGTVNDDTIAGDTNNNNLIGESGNDILSGNTGNDTLNGGDGNDQIFGDFTTISTLGGNDTIIGSSGDDTINGGVGSDTVNYSSLTDAITLLAGGIVNKGIFGTDKIVDIETVIGAIGQNNTIDASTGVALTTSLTANLATNSLTINGLPAPINSLTLNVQNFVNIVGTTQGDNLKGNNLANELIGNEGNDTIQGLGGDDLLDGGDGNDQLLGGDGTDQLLGGLGNDSLQGDNGNDFLSGDLGNDTLRGGNGDDILDGGIGNDSILGGANNDLIFGNVGDDILFGEAGDDLVFGDDGNDRLYGGDGIDDLNGGTGKDLLYGGNSNDILFGNDDDDTLFGEAGDDLLDGGKGNDVLHGGLGNDIFAIAVGNGNDIVQDFQIGFDKIGLSGGLLFTQLTIFGFGTNTFIRNTSTSELLATLQNVNVGLINSADFTTV